MKHILIVGNGSIGKRHARNLHALGAGDIVLSVVDPREDRRHELDDSIPIQDRFSGLAAALAKPQDYAGAVIATAPALHCEHATLLMKHGIPIYMEKGLALTARDCNEILNCQRETQVSVLMGYTWRWAHSIQELTNLLCGGIGRIIRVNMVMAANLHDWHPWEPLSEFYIATRGGVENESHWIDLMLMWFGKPIDITGEVAPLARDIIDISQNDHLDMTAYYENMRCHIHLDLYTRPHEKTIKFIGTEGTIEWRPNEIRIDDRKNTDLLQSGDTWSEIETYDDERNVMFVNAMLEWLSVLDGVAEPSCTLQDGADVIDIIERLRKLS